MPAVNAYAAPREAAPLEKTVIQRRELGPLDVLIDIAFAGICHSDIHTVRGDWGPQQYPLAPGHEITGTVAAVGEAVARYAVGDRVGVGCLVNSCGECRNCLRGEEQFCTQGAVLTYGGIDRDGTVTQGGYSEQVVVTEAFVLRIPTLCRWTSPHRCCARASRPIRRCGTGTSDPAHASRSSGSAASGTWECRSPMLSARR